MSISSKCTIHPVTTGWLEVKANKEENNEMRRDLAAALAFVLILSCMAMADEVPRISREEVKEMLDNPDMIIIDVRTDSSWHGSELKIKGAVREDPSDVTSWMDKYSKDKTLVFY